MTKSQGSGVSVLVRLADSALRQLQREQARSFIDGLDDAELADVMDAVSSAALARGDGYGNLLYESAAARLRGVDVETFSSCTEERTTQ